MSWENAEDGFAVNNLYVENIPNYFTEQLLWIYFSRFGEVSSAKIRFDDDRGMLYALIHFEEAESVASALSSNQHYIFGQWQYVYGASRWWRPNFEREIKTKSNSSIMILNDYCLLHIFSFLPIWEKIKLSRMNQRFKQIFEITDVRNKTVSLCNLTLMEIRYVCREFGHLIKTINVEDLNNPFWTRNLHINNPLNLSKNLNRAPHYVTKYCRELRSLSFENMEIWECTQFEKLENLTKLSLRNCEITDHVCFHLSQLQNLQYLDVSENRQLTGKYLMDFPELTHLNIDGCIGIEQHHFLAFCSHRRVIENLKSLNLAECFYIRTNIIGKISSLENLENLEISTNDLSLLQDIRGLKQLIIYTADSLFRQYGKLTENNIPRLETLFIVGENDPFPFEPSKTVKNFIFSIKTIKKLGLLQCCNLDDEDMTKIAALPELMCLNVTGCQKISSNGLLHLFEKTNKLQHVDISDCGLYDKYIPPSMMDIIQKKMKETGRTVHCTLYSKGIKCSEKSESEDSSPLLTLVGERSTFPGMKQRDFYRYEFED